MKRTMSLFLLLCFIVSIAGTALSVTDDDVVLLGEGETALDNAELVQDDAEPAEEEFEPFSIQETEIIPLATPGENDVALLVNGGNIYIGPGAVYPTTLYASTLNNGSVVNSGWNDWRAVYGYTNPLIIGATLNKAYTVDAVELYIYHDGGGCLAPSEIIIEYWDEEAEEFKPVAEQSKTAGFTGSTGNGLSNTITFEPVATTKIQAVMKHTSDRAIMLKQFKVYSDDPVQPRDPSDNCALPANGGSVTISDTVIPELNNGTYNAFWTDRDTQNYSSDVVVVSTFDKVYRVDAADITIFQQYEAEGYTAVIKPPETITLEYWDMETRTWTPVSGQSPTNDFTGNPHGGGAINVIEFDPVETTSIRASLTHATDKAIGLYEFAVYGEPVARNVALASNGGQISLDENTVQNPGLALLNNGLTTYSSGNWNDFDNRSGYPYYANGYDNDARICVSFQDAFTIGEVRLFLIYETAAAAGCKLPAQITIQYWDESNGEFVDVEGQSSNTGFTGNAYTGSTFDPDVITFDPVKTSKIQLVVKHGDTNGKTPNAAVWFTEIEVYTFDLMEEKEVKGFELPPVAAMVAGVADPVIDLNARDGTWQFLLTPPAGVPAPESGHDESFDFSAWNGEDWQDVIVPGGLVMQGFDIKNNTEYYYRRQVQIPADYTGQRVIIRFDAVYTNARVWVDGQYIRTHKGGFTTWDCDITDSVTPGQTVTLTVGVADIYRNTVGTWNPSGAWKDDPSGATYYANHNIGGIIRDVSLMALPQDYIARIYTNTVFTDDTYTDANLEIQAQLGMVSENATLLLEVVSQNDTVVASGIIDFASKGNEKSALEEKTIFVPSPLKWDAEHPNLYTLRATVLTDEDVREISTQKFGFRQIDFGGSYGDINKVYINGSEIQLRGVCRHDVSWELGRSITKEMAWQEIQDYKDANINFIRTSHYPVSKHLLDACDALGIYVEEENAACWGPVSGSPPEEYLNGFKEVIERDRNRASILIWSIANESTWADGFRMCYDYVREEDPSRLVIFSYPSTLPSSEAGDVYFDIYSVHYDTWDSTNLGSATMPVLHDEYAPSSIHHYYEVQRDLSAKVFYEQSLYKMWDNILRTDGALGGAVWCANDEVFFIPEGTTKYRGMQGYYDGYATGDGAWGNMHDAFKRLKTEAWLTKKAYSPVRIQENMFTVLTDALSIPVRSGFDHTNFTELAIRYTIDGGSVKTAAPPNIPPHGTGKVVINDSALNGAKQVNLIFYTTFNGVESLVDEFKINLIETVYEFTPASDNPPSLIDADGLITVSGQNFSIVFDKETGLIQKADYKEDVLITGGPYLYIPDADFGKLDNRWIPAASDAITAKIEGNLAVITLKGAYARGQGVEFIISVSGNGIITTHYMLTSQPEAWLATVLKEVGISYDIPSDIQSVDWARETFHNVYPANNIGRAQGEAQKVRPGYEENPDEYGKFPDWDWYMDMKEFSLFVTDDPRDGIVTNDFKTMRENIWYYDVNFNGTDSKISVESDTNSAAKVEVKPKWELIDATNKRVQYTGVWTQRNNHTGGYLPSNGYTNNYAYNRTEMITTTTGASCELVFEGTGVSFITAKQNEQGLLRVYIDGELKRTVDAYGPWGRSKRRIVYSINGLENGTHTIKVERIDGMLAVDAFGVLKGPATDPALQESQLVVNQQWYHPDLNWGSYSGTPPTLARATTGVATIRLTDTDNAMPVETKPKFVPVANITGIAQIMPVNSSVSLSAVVLPANATGQNIVWSMKDDGATGATLTENVLKTGAEGIVVITAAIDDFTKDFAISVRSNVALAANGGVMYRTADTYEEASNTVRRLNDGIIGRSAAGYWADWKGDYLYAGPATIGVALSQSYSVDAVELYVMNDGGGCYPPGKITVQYWNGSEYVTVSNQSPLTGFQGNYNASYGNLITFDPVDTTDIRMILEHGTNDQGDVRAIALTEYAVYMHESGFDPVSDITGIPAVMTIGTDLTLNGVATPSYATNTDIVWSIKDAGQTGATLVDNILSADFAGVVVITACVENGAAVSVDYSRDFSITVTEATAPVITSADNYACTAGIGGTFALVASGTTPISFTLNGAPTGVTVNGGNLIIGGMVAAKTYTFTITANNKAGSSVPQSFTLTVTAAVVPVITSADSYSCTGGAGGTFTLTASGTTPITFSLNGAPTGVTVSGGSLIVADTLAAGTYNFTITAGNKAGSSAPQNFTLTVTPMDANVFTITFDANGGSVSPASAQTGADGKLAALPTPTRSGSYRWDGWFTERSGGTAVTVSTVFAGNITIYAHWTQTGNGNAVTPSPTPADEEITPASPPPLAEGWSNPYSDVADSDWFYNVVRFVNENGLMEGVGTDTFGPYTSVTRAMLVTILYRLEGKPAVSGDIPFSDVKSGEWYSDAILWASQNGIVYGYTSEIFKLNDQVTREQAVTILYRYAKTKGLDVSAQADLLAYNDRQMISDWALPAVQWAVAAGIINGRTANTIVPAGTSNRAEAATIFKRYIEAFLDEGESKMT